ncbi:hypothetical protein [Paludisphaera soli]|uniref:hypothetical protein n=1 Tax=Paludisphaera soli TaxID=2712865 RepID=UPI0013EAA72E|nr:hypothetical protein [Paludisphaera soli]
MDRILRLGAPALALALLVGCGTSEDAMPVDSSKEAPGMPPVAAPAKDDAPAPAPSRAEPVAPIPSATEAAPDPVAEPKKDGEPGLEGPSASEVKLSDEEIAAIKKLPADEQDAALKQAICPVSDEHLGAMDVPLKVTAEGRTFYLCCEGCKKAVEEDPKAVLAKLDKK